VHVTALTPSLAAPHPWRDHQSLLSLATGSELLGCSCWGPSALGQGGAGVASASGPGSVYWNPALPGLGAPGILDIGTFGVDLAVATSLSIEGNTLKSADDLYDFYRSADIPGMQARLNTPGGATPSDVNNALQFVNLLVAMEEDGSGAYLTAGGSAEVRFGWFTVFAHDRAWTGANPVVDTVNLSLSSGGAAAIFPPLLPTPVTPATAGGMAARDAFVTAGLTTNQANALAIQSETALGPALNDPAVVQALAAAVYATTHGGGDLADNASGFDIKGVNLTEIGVAASIPLIEKMLAVGVSLKEVRADSSWTRLLAVQTGSGDYLAGIKDGFQAHRKITYHTNVDAGVAASPIEGLQFGLTGKNLIRMEIPLKDRSDHITLDPQVRAGASWQPIGLLSLALDGDLLETKSDILNGYRSQFVGGGAGLHLFGVAVLRGGLMQNVAVDGAKPTYTAGLDLYVWKFRLGVAGAYSPSQVAISTADTGFPVEVPQRVSITADVGFGLEW
jgi:hypothetical protein